MLASGSSDHTVCLWNLATGKEVRLYHEGAIRSVCFSPNGTWLACGASDRAVRLWDVSTMDDMHLSSLWRISTGSRSLSFSPDGTVIAAGSSDGSVRLWGLSAGGPLCKPLAHGGRVRSVCFSPDGSVLASGSSDGTVMLWDVCELTDAEARREYFTGAIEPLHGVDLTGLDFSMAKIDEPHDREVLRQNGAAVWP
jgi:WD40 repeat protein